MPLEQQRSHILEAAQRVFAQHDLGGATIERVAREAGVTRPAVYEFFKDKEDLFIAVTDDAGSRLTKALQDGYARFEPAERQSLVEFVHHNVTLLFDFIAANPGAAAVLRIVDRGTVVAATAEMGLTRHRIEDDLTQIYETGWTRADNEISPEAARLLALATLAMVEAVGFRQSTEPGWDTEATIDVLTTFIVGGLARLSRDPGRLESFGR
jgi:AcrR family transcriptional regulator